MEERQRQIREGAGLEESRLNQEFIELLRKYSTPLLLIIAAVAGGYAGWNYLEKQRDQARDKAFVELESGLASRSPKTLADVADEYGSRASVAPLARLGAADLHLQAFRTGVRAGLQVQTDQATGQPKLPEGEKYLTDEERTGELGQAAALYKLVADNTASDDARALLAIGALDGLASVAESRGQMDEARASYEKIIEKAKGAGYEALAVSAKRRLDTLGTLTTVPKLYAMLDLPAAAPGTGTGGKFMKVQTGPDGTMQLMEDPANPGKLTPVETPPAPGAPPEAAPGAPGGTPVPVAPAPTTPAPTTPPPASPPPANPK